MREEGKKKKSQLKNRGLARGWYFDGYWHKSVRFKTTFLTTFAKLKKAPKLWPLAPNKTTHQFTLEKKEKTFFGLGFFLRNQPA